CGSCSPPPLHFQVASASLSALAQASYDATWQLSFDDVQRLTQSDGEILKRTVRQTSHYRLFIPDIKMYLEVSMYALLPTILYLRMTSHPMSQNGQNGTRQVVQTNIRLPWGKT
ncbi:unnamed protein product, partial [Ectocarpus sp. 6 AP-2014]